MMYNRFRGYPRISYRKKSEGSALITVLIAAFCILVLISIGFIVIQEAIRATKIELSLKGQAFNVAASGITEGLSWFRSRRTQPVRHFNPKPSGHALPGESGLIRQFEVSKSANVWGRYALNPESVEDISEMRGRGRKGDGLVWRVRSQGILYINRNPEVPFNQKPNEIVHRLTLMTEFQRLNINPPVASALLAQNGNQVEILEGGRISGQEGAAITYAQNTGRPIVAVASEVRSQKSLRLSSARTEAYDLDVRSVFGVTWRELRELADLYVDSSALLPEPLPHMAIIVIDADAVFDHERPLSGGGLLIVDGNLEITANSNSNFGGFIYVRGNFTMDAPALISGSMIVLGQVRLQGFGDFAEIQYNGDLISTMKQRLGQYRQTQAMIKVQN